MRDDVPALGNCMKCNTPGKLYEYRSNWWICRGNACWNEEVERDRNVPQLQRQAVEDYRQLVASTRG
jgi:hypothetical protein